MKVLITIISVAGLAFAEGGLGVVAGGTSPPPQLSSGVLYEQPYDFPTLRNGLLVNAPVWACADDFTFNNESTITDITLWMAFTGTEHPYAIIIEIYENSSDSLGTLLWEEEVSAAMQTETATGDQNWGLDLYRCDLQIQNPPTLSAGSYWLLVKIANVPANIGWLVCRPTYPPNMIQYHEGDGWRVVPYDAWFGLYNNSQSLSKNTWGSIKTAY